MNRLRNRRVKLPTLLGGGCLLALGGIFLAASSNIETAAAQNVKLEKPFKDALAFTSNTNNTTNAPAAGSFASAWIIGQLEGNHNEINLETGADYQLFNNTASVDVYGTDLAIPQYDPLSGWVFYIFGDTFGKDSNKGNNEARTHKRGNVMSWATYDPSDIVSTFTFDDWVADSNGAMELIPAERTGNPKADSAIPNSMYVDPVSMNIYISVSQTIWGNQWDSLGSRLFRTYNLYDYDPAPKASFDGDSKFVDIFMLGKGDGAPETVFMYGTPKARTGYVYLAAALSDKLEDKANYRYWDGTPEGTTNETAAISLFDEYNMSELSVTYNPNLGYMMLYGVQSTGIRMRTSPNGIDWSDYIQILDCEEDGYNHCYAPMTIKELSSDDGKVVFFTMSRMTEPKKGHLNDFWDEKIPGGVDRCTIEAQCHKVYNSFVVEAMWNDES